ATASAYQPTSAGGGSDAYLSVISPTGGHLTYSTYFGGSGGTESIYGVALDGLGRATVCGFTASANFPTTLGAFDTTLGGSADGFAARFDPILPGAASLAWSTFVGGSGNSDQALSIALAPGGEPVILGSTDSSDLPGT